MATAAVGTIVMVTAAAPTSTAATMTTATAIGATAMVAIAVAATVTNDLMVTIVVATAVGVRESSPYLAAWLWYKITSSKWEVGAEKGDDVDNEEDESGLWLSLP